MVNLLCIPGIAPRNDVILQMELSNEARVKDAGY